MNISLTQATAIFVYLVPEGILAIRDALIEVRKCLFLLPFFVCMVIISFVLEYRSKGGIVVIS